MASVRSIPQQTIPNVSARSHSAGRTPGRLAPDVDRSLRKPGLSVRNFPALRGFFGNSPCCGDDPRRQHSPRMLSHRDGRVIVSVKNLGAALGLILLMVVAAPQSAAAATITLTAVDGNLYQQTVQNPCIFTNASCQQGDWVGQALPVGGAVDGYDEVVSYTNSELQAQLGSDVLLLGLDINQ